jgi:hypothetical protein
MQRDAGFLASSDWRALADDLAIFLHGLGPVSLAKAGGNHFRHPK